MKLIGSYTSPFVRKARIVLAEKRIEYEFVVDNPFDPARACRDFNPLGKVPVLVTDDGAAIYDSSVIVEYLDTISPVGRLIPEPGRQRIQVKRWEALADGLMEAAILSCWKAAGRRSSKVANGSTARVAKVSEALRVAAHDLAEKRLVRRRELQPGGYRARLRAGLPRFPLCRSRLAHCSIPISSATREKLFKRPPFEATEPRDHSSRVRGWMQRMMQRYARVGVSADDAAAQAHLAVVEHHRLSRRDRPLRIARSRSRSCRRPRAATCRAHRAAGSGSWRRKPARRSGAAPRSS